MSFATRPDTILEEAQRIVEGARQSDYGPPPENHGRTATLYNAYLEARPPGPLTAVDVCMLNILQKISRGMHTLTRDTCVDGAGYFDNAWRCREEIVP